MRSLPAVILILLAAAGCGSGEDQIDPELARQLVVAGGIADGPLVLPIYADTSAFLPLPEAREGDWRLGPGSDEAPQSFVDYARSDPVRATDTRARIVIQPIGPFEDRGRRVLDLMREYGEIFFACPVAMAEPAELPTDGRRTRRHGDRGWDQYLTTEILEEILEPRLPDDAIAMLGITEADLYPEASWNFVFGQARLRSRIGVYSLARYSETFWGGEEGADAFGRAVERACKVFAHETGHMFGMEHCLHFLCVMNGSNSLEETDRQPIWLCPVCASKLTWNRGFDPAKRYQGLAEFFARVPLPEVAEWYRARADAAAIARDR